MAFIKNDCSQYTVVVC